MQNAGMQNGLYLSGFVGVHHDAPAAVMLLWDSGAS